MFPNDKSCTLHKMSIYLFQNGLGYLDIAQRRGKMQRQRSIVFGTHAGPFGMHVQESRHGTTHDTTTTTILLYRRDRRSSSSSTGSSSRRWSRWSGQKRATIATTANTNGVFVVVGCRRATRPRRAKTRAAMPWSCSMLWPCLLHHHHHHHALDVVDHCLDPPYGDDCSTVCSCTGMCVCQLLGGLVIGQITLFAKFSNRVFGSSTSFGTKKRP
jgi:hypothetical protein